MANFFKALFGGKTEDTEEEKLKNRKKNFDILKFDGLRAQKMGKLDYAARCLAEAIAIEEDFETMSYLAGVYIQQGQLEDSREVLQRMIEMEPELEATYITLANVCYLQEDYPAMAEICQKVFEIKSDNPTSHYLLAKAKYGQKDHLNTIASLTKAIVLKEDFTEALLMRAQVLLEMHQPEEAGKDIETLLEHNPEDEQAVLEKGRLKEALGNTTEALELYNGVLDINPFNEQAYLYLAQLLISEKRFDEAIEKLDEAVELHPDSAKTYHERGRAKLLKGDKEGSTQDMKKSLELSNEEISKMNGEFNNFSDLYANNPL